MKIKLSRNYQSFVVSFRQINVINEVRTAYMVLNNKGTKSWTSDSRHIQDHEGMVDERSIAEVDRYSAPRTLRHRQRPTYCQWQLESSTNQEDKVWFEEWTVTREELDHIIRMLLEVWVRNSIYSIHKWSTWTCWIWRRCYWLEVSQNRSTWPIQEGH